MRSFDITIIPEELRAVKQFCLRVEKQPYIRDGPNTYTSTGWSMNQSGWMSADEAIRLYTQGVKVFHRGELRQVEGIGFLVDRRSGILGGDLDCCRDPETGEISPWAAGILREIWPFYTEVSPSGCGLRFFVFGQMGENQCTFTGTQDDVSDEMKARILKAKPKARERLERGGEVFNVFEIYASGKHLTITGHRIEEYCFPSEDRTRAINDLLLPYRAIPKIEQIGREIQQETRRRGQRLPEIRIGDVIDLTRFKQHGKQLAGPHPVFGSTTGHNLVVDTARGVWYSFHAGAEGGGDAWTWLACECGAIDWQGAGAGSLKEPDVLKRTLRHALDRGLISAEEYQKWSSGDMTNVPEITEEELKRIKISENPRLRVNLEPDNLIVRYIKYGKTCCDAYQEYHYASVLVMLSIATDRKLVLRLAQGDVYPNMWAFLLGRSTVSRKSAAIEKARRFLDALFPERSLPQGYSPEALIEVLAENPHGYLIKDEAGAMLAAMQKNYMLEMRDLYCTLYDCTPYRRKIRRGQRRQPHEFVIMDPFLNILTATTPETFREYTALIDLTSGWLLRFLYFYPNYKKEWMPFRPPNGDDFELFGEIAGRLSRVREMFSNRTEPVEMTLTPNAWEFYQRWQQKRESDLQDRTTSAIRLALWGRLSLYALKLAMLFTIGKSNYDLKDCISLEHLREACRQIDEYFLRVGEIVAEEVAREEEKNLQNKILGTVQRAGGAMSRRALLRALHVRKKDVEEALDTLVESGEISVVSVCAREGGRPCTMIILAPPEDIQQGENGSVTNVTMPHTSQVSHEFNRCHTNSCDTNDTFDIWDVKDISLINANGQPEISSHTCPHHIENHSPGDTAVEVMEARELTTGPHPRAEMSTRAAMEELAQRHAERGEKIKDEDSWCDQNASPVEAFLRENVPMVMACREKRDRGEQFTAEWLASRVKALPAEALRFLQKARDLALAKDTRTTIHDTYWVWLEPLNRTQAGT